MSEKEKMLRGEAYDAADPELIADRVRANRLCMDYNAQALDETDTCHPIMKKLLQAKGDFIIKPPFYCDYGYNIHLGKNVFINYNCVMLDVSEIEIGDNTLIGPSVQIYTACHPLEANERKAGVEFGRKVRIGENVWIGGNVTILPGVEIGDNAVIGAGSVVTKKIPADAIAAGNPCKIIRYAK